MKNNSADAAVLVLDGEVSEHEVRLDRVLDEFAVTMIFVLTSEGACPPGAPDDFAAGRDLHATPGRGPVTLFRRADIVSHRGSIPLGAKGYHIGGGWGFSMRPPTAVLS